MSLDYNGAEGQMVPRPTVAGLPSWLVRYGQTPLPSDRRGATQGILLGTGHQALFSVWARFNCKRCLLWSPLLDTRSSRLRCHGHHSPDPIIDPGVTSEKASSPGPCRRSTVVQCCNLTMFWFFQSATPSFTMLLAWWGVPNPPAPPTAPAVHVKQRRAESTGGLL